MSISTEKTSSLRKYSRQNVASILANIDYYPISIYTTSGKGMGIKAEKPIPKEIIIAKNVGKYINHHEKISMSLAQYLFVDPSSYRRESENSKYFMACGELVFLNHNANPNARVSFSKIDNNFCLVELISIKEILKSEEITIKYTDIADYVENKLISFCPSLTEKNT